MQNAIKLECKMQIKSKNKKTKLYAMHIKPRCSLKLNDQKTCKEGDQMRVRISTAIRCKIHSLPKNEEKRVSLIEIPEILRRLRSISINGQD